MTTMKTGILLVAFGSSRQQANLSLRRFDDKVRQRFPGLPARWAFTSGIIRERLADAGKKTDSVAKALQKMWFEKYDQVAVQPLHTVPGAEYSSVLADADAFRSGAQAFGAVTVGGPLMTGPSDASRVADAVFASLPEGRGPHDAVVLMGHGTWHPGDSAYDALLMEVQRRDPLVFVATMEGRLTIADVRARLVAADVKSAFLVPLLSVPGRHVQKDMAGKEPDSWLSILTEAGLDVQCVMQGMAEYGEYADIWLDRLAVALDELDHGHSEPPGPA